MNNTKNLYIVVAIIAVIAIGLYWYFGVYKKPQIKTVEEALGVLDETPPSTVETNPVKKVPDLNPVEKINPFKTSNPFE